MRVFVYFNLHKRLWSLRAMEGPDKGRVIAHRELVSLEDCTFKVSEAGRQRVIREQRKNVHAGVVGTLIPNDTNVYEETWRRVSYNPYKGPTFVALGTLEPVYEAPMAVLVARPGKKPAVWATYPIRDMDAIPAPTHDGVVMHTGGPTP